MLSRLTSATSPRGVTNEQRRGWPKALATRGRRVWAVLALVVTVSSTSAAFTATQPVDALLESGRVELSAGDVSSLTFGGADLSAIGPGTTLTQSVTVTNASTVTLPTAYTEIALGLIQVERHSIALGWVGHCRYRSHGQLVAGRQKLSTQGALRASLRQPPSHHRSGPSGDRRTAARSPVSTLRVRSTRSRSASQQAQRTGQTLPPGSP